jgi:hypothetical protein
MDDVSFVKCCCPVEPNFPRPHQAPGLFNLFLLAWLFLHGAGKGGLGLFCLIQSLWFLMEIEETRAGEAGHGVPFCLF